MRRTAVNTLKTFIKRCLGFAIPELSSKWLAIRADAHGQRILREAGVDSVVEKLVATSGWRVAQGPFEGMQLVPTAVCSSLAPKLVGAYEEELHGFIRSCLEKEYDIVVDVGSAEGYYAVGFALRGKIQGSVFAFDINPMARQLCQKVAELNKVESKLSIGAACSCEVLAKLVDNRRSLVISDCEGWETRLFEKAYISAFSRSDVLVELHDHVSPDATAILTRLFDSTHSCKLIKTRSRDWVGYSALAVLSEQEAVVALNEFRGRDQYWLCATPKL